MRFLAYSLSAFCFFGSTSLFAKTSAEHDETFGHGLRASSSTLAFDVEQAAQDYGVEGVERHLGKSKCDPGEFYKNSKDKCLKCAKGMYQPESKKTSCIECGPGYYQPSEGQASCIQVPIGWASSYSNGATSIKECTGKYYSSEPGKVGCSYCSPPKISRGTSCGACEAGKEGVSIDVRTTECRTCGPGYWSDPEETNGKCRACPAGQVSSADHKSCDACPLGQPAAKDMGSCLTYCPIGTYYEKDNDDCLPCANMYYNPFEGATSCIPCPDGTISAADRKTCKACPAGTFRRGPDCANAFIGNKYYIAVDGTPGAKRCPNGYVANDSNTGCLRA